MAALDLEALSEAERATTDRRALVGMLLVHGERISESRRPDAAELALRKATRAHILAQELGDCALVVEALRARLGAARRAPGRDGLTARLARELVTQLEALAVDTRRERAEVLATTRTRPWWWYHETRAPKRADVAADEANLREALALLRDLGDDAADDFAIVARDLLGLLFRCCATAAEAELRAELRGASPVVRAACARLGLHP